MKTKKKNPFLHGAIWLLVMTILAVCAFSGSTTLARYAAVGSGTATANVAKWSIEVTDAIGKVDIAVASPRSLDVDLFDTITNNTGGLMTGQTVPADSPDNIAPGTSGSLAGLAVKNNSDVTVDITVAVTALTNTSNVPIKFNGSATAGDLATAFVKFASVAPGDTKTLAASDITWVWDIDDGTATSLGDADNTKGWASDSLIGAAAYAGTVQVIATVKVTAIQVS